MHKCPNCGKEFDDVDKESTALNPDELSFLGFLREQEEIKIDWYEANSYLPKGSLKKMLKSLQNKRLVQVSQDGKRCKYFPDINNAWGKAKPYV